VHALDGIIALKEHWH